MALGGGKGGTGRTSQKAQNLEGGRRILPFKSPHHILQSFHCRRFGYLHAWAGQHIPDQLVSPIPPITTLQQNLGLKTTPKITLMNVWDAKNGRNVMHPQWGKNL